MTRHFTTAVYKSGTGTRGRGHGDACVGTWGRETRDLGTSSMGRGDVWDGDAGAIMIIEKVGGKCDKSHFPREYVLVKATYPAPLIGFLHACLRSEHSAKIPCIEES